MENITDSYQIKQRYGKQQQIQYYSVSKDGTTLKRKQSNKTQRENEHNTLVSLLPWLIQVLREVFLPEGYPSSVSNDYIAYQVWDTVQAFCSSITNILATQGVLKGAGVGDVKATAMAATITWVLKSGSGMAGSILFAWARGSHLDCYCKQWRFTADVLNDVATCVEILAPTAGPEYFLYVMCVAGLAKSIVGVAGGSTRAAVTSHQARQGNMADVSAKDGSQETLVNLTALVIGLAMIPLVNENPVIIWSLYLLLTALHLYANYHAVRVLRMEFVNLIRFQLVIRHYFNSGDIMSIEQANRKEPIFLSFFTRATEYKLGARLVDECENNLCYVDKGFIIQKKGREIRVALDQNFSTETLLESIFYSELSVYLQNRSHAAILTWSNEFRVKAAATDEMSSFNELFQVTLQDFRSKFKRSDWNTDVIKVTLSPWRFEKHLGYAKDD